MLNRIMPITSKSYLNNTSTRASATASETSPLQTRASKMQVSTTQLCIMARSWYMSCNQISSKVLKSTSSLQTSVPSWSLRASYS